MKHPGFTLAELLIALALLGIIAAFTIPKVLESSAQQERVARLRETASILEDAWYTAKNRNSLQWGVVNTLDGAVSAYLNLSGQGSTDVVGNGEPFRDDSHLCNSLDATGGTYVILVNGTIITFSKPGPIPPWPSMPASVTNVFMCIDVSGTAPPNEPGQDIFTGTFNPWGDFDTLGGDATYTPGENHKAFLWGNATEPVRNSNGTPVIISPQTQVGYWLTR